MGHSTFKVETVAICIMGILRENQHMWAWFQCRTSPKDICDVTIWPIHRVLLFIELCGANRPCIWPTSVLQKWACPMTKQFPVCWTSLARSDPSSLRVINIFGADQWCDVKSAERALN
jgi:hypothetical protein